MEEHKTKNIKFFSIFIKINLTNAKTSANIYLDGGRNKNDKFKEMDIMKLNTVKESLFEEIDNMMKNTTDRIELLNREERKDEVNLEKVKLNVYDIFKTMYGASEKKVEGAFRNASEEEKLVQFEKAYLGFFDNIPKAWYESLEKAKKHDDFEKVHIEEIKLDAMNNIKEMFIKLWKETD